MSSSHHPSTSLSACLCVTVSASRTLIDDVQLKERLFKSVLRVVVLEEQDREGEAATGLVWDIFDSTLSILLNLHFFQGEESRLSGKFQTALQEMKVQGKAHATKEKAEIKGSND